MQEVLVVGGAGFIGSHICEALLNKGYQVICLDNFVTGDKKNIEHLLDNPHFQFIEQDITEKIPNSKFQISNIKFIFHLASPASPNKKSPRSYINHPVETLLVNSLGTYNLLELAKKTNAQFLYASSSEIYGDPAVSPQDESYFGNVNPNGVRSVYDEGKRFGEAMTMAYVRTHNVDARIVRIFNTYGPNMQKDDGRVISNFITQAIANDAITMYGDGKQTRSFCFVSDMIDGLQQAMFAKNTKGQVFNLGNQDERTIIDLATLIKKMTQSVSDIVFEPLPQDDPRNRRPDSTKAKMTFGWEPKVALHEGLEKTIQYFRSI